MKLDLVMKPSEDRYLNKKYQVVVGKSTIDALWLIIRKSWMRSKHSLRD